MVYNILKRGDLHMEPINEDNSTKNEFTQLIKTIAVYEAKSAIAKLKLLKYITEKGFSTVGRVIDNAGEKIDNKLKENENNHNL